MHSYIQVKQAMPFAFDVFVAVRQQEKLEKLPSKSQAKSQAKTQAKSQAKSAVTAAVKSAVLPRRKRSGVGAAGRAEGGVGGRLEAGARNAVVGHKVWVLSASSAAEKGKWLSELRRVWQIGERGIYSGSGYMYSYCTHAWYSYTVLIHYTHTLYSYTLYSYTILIHYTHTLYSYTILIHCTLTTHHTHHTYHTHPTHPTHTHTHPPPPPYTIHITHHT
jgi:hypothetical protein